MRLDDDPCVNCGANGAGLYCADCGQKRRFARYTVPSLARNWAGRVLNVEEGLFHTALLLSTKPGQPIRDYIAGRTRPYTQPLGYVLICCAVFALVNHAVGGGTSAGSDNRTFTLLLIPCIAAASRLVFLRSGFNYAEQLILAMYIFAQVVLFAALVLATTGLFRQSNIESASPAVLPALALFVAGYVGWVYAAVFNRNRIFAALGGLLSVALGLIVWFALLAAFVSAFRRVVET